MEQYPAGHNPAEPSCKALFPFFVFLIFYLGLSIAANDFYSVPMPVAFLVASAVALLQNRKEKLHGKVEIFARGMGDSNIMIMCLIFILAGAFAATAKAMGAVDATVVIARSVIPEQFLLAGFFLVSCFISVAIGTSCGTIAALTPIAAGLVNSIGISPALMIGTVIGGAMFGDNLSMISDTTIAATRTQGVAMRDKFLTNLRIVFPAALTAILLYVVLGQIKEHSGGAGDLVSSVTFSHLIAVLPYVTILVGAIAGGNVMALLFLGTCMAMVIGIVNGSFTFWGALSEVGKGSIGMAETLIVALLAGGLLGVIRCNGGIRYLLNKIERMVSGTQGGELGVALLVCVINLFTANNTVAIVIAGPIAKALSEKYHCNPKRVASILDTASCVVQGLIPYGAQILIAVGIAKNAGVEVPSLVLIASLYYPILLGIVLIFSILFRKNKTC